MRTTRACTVATDALRLVEPTLTLIREPRPRLRFRSRPGDRCLPFGAQTLRAVPEWSTRGAWWLPGQEYIEVPELVAGPDGTAELALPEALDLGAVTVHIQGLVLPAGPQEQMEDAGRWTPVLSIRPDDG